MLHFAVESAGTNLTPTFLTSKLYLDFSNDDEFEAVIDDLVRAIHGEPLFKKPELGNNPFKPASQTPTVKNHDISSDILKTIIAIYEGGRDAIEDKLVYNHLNLSRIVFEIHAKQLHEQGFVNYSQGWVFVTDKAKIHAVQQGWIK